MKAKPAYDAYDAGRKALKSKNADLALAEGERGHPAVAGRGHISMRCAATPSW